MQWIHVKHTVSATCVDKSYVLLTTGPRMLATHTHTECIFVNTVCTMKTVCLILTSDSVKGSQYNFCLSDVIKQ